MYPFMSGTFLAVCYSIVIIALLFITIAISAIFSKRFRAHYDYYICNFVGIAAVVDIFGVGAIFAISSYIF